MGIVLLRARDAPRHGARPAQQGSLLLSHVGVSDRVAANRNSVHRADGCAAVTWFARGAAAHDGFKRAVLHLHANFPRKRSIWSPQHWNASRVGRGAGAGLAW